jgi:shikimate 5-dehydrogenase
MAERDPLPLNARLAPSAYVGEVILKSQTTPFLAAARARGCSTQIGLDLLFEQVRLDRRKGEHLERARGAALPRRAGR